jgi:flagellar hook-associated protein 2
MAMRVTGMVSGLDTESIIQELVAAKQTKVDEQVKAQTKVQWTQDAWKDLNTKIKSLKSSFDSLQYESTFSKKTTKVSDSSVADVVTGDTAMLSVQSLKVKQLAKAGYLTGAEIQTESGDKATSGTLLKDLGIEAGSSFTISVGGKDTTINIDENSTIGSITNQLSAAGVNVNFDSANQRFFIASSSTGAASNFTLTATDDKGTDALSKLGILTYDDSAKSIYQKYADMASDTDARDAAIQSRVDELVKTYTSEKSGLQSGIDSLNTKQEDLVKAYGEEYGAIDITDEDARTARADELNANIAALTADLEDDTLTEDEKAEKQAELNQAKGELSYINGYNDNAAAIAEKQARIDEIDSTYLNEDGTAKDSILTDAEAYVQEKIDKAVDVINNYDDLQKNAGAVKIEGQDAIIELNGATFKSSGNTFEINGLTISCKAETGDNAITLTTETDTSGIYDMIKKFITQYSSLINEMDKLYNADSSSGYEPLTDDEKDSMSDTEIEKWETTIKDSLLRRDSNLNTISSALKEVMASGYEVNGTKMYLFDFGIETAGYFSAADNEKNAYHIYGDEDDDVYASESNTLQAMISANPDTVKSFFTQLSKALYSKMSDLSGRVSGYRSYGSYYDDVKLQSDYDDYTTKISDLEDKLADYEDKWYSKFSAMETALAKLQSNSSAVTSLLGG